MIPLERIKERKLFQWAVAYLAGAWLLLQVLELVGEPFAWPDLVLRGATVLLGVGFFAVLVLAWYHGEQGRQRASGVELLMLAGILLLATIAVASVSRSGAPPTLDDPASASAFAASTSVAEQRSIAVLPFWITAQLVDAENGFHLWSETYDRDLSDVATAAGREYAGPGCGPGLPRIPE